MNSDFNPLPASFRYAPFRWERIKKKKTRMKSKSKICKLFLGRVSLSGISQDWVYGL